MNYTEFTRLFLNLDAKERFLIGYILPIYRNRLMTLFKKAYLSLEADFIKKHLLFDNDYDYTEFLKKWFKIETLEKLLTNNTINLRLKI